MHPVEITPVARHEITQLHAATCLMMTRFIDGDHCPKLAHVIVQQLQRLLNHPQTQQAPESSGLYRQLLDHWLNVSNSLSTPQKKSSEKYLFH